MQTSLMLIETVCSRTHTRMRKVSYRFTQRKYWH